MDINLNYSELISLATSKTSLKVLQFSETSTRYVIYFPDGVMFWYCNIEKGGSDATDFETNYKAGANGSITSEGFPISVPNYQETQMFNNESIRDTNAHNSVSATNFGYRVKTIIIDNQLNQTVSMQCQASRDGSTWFNLGNPFTIGANTMTYESCDAYFPYMRGIATCSIAPSTGSLNAWMEKMGV